MQNASQSLRQHRQINRFPGGRRSRGLPPLARDPKIRKAQRIIEAKVAEKATVAAEPERPWAELSKPEQLLAATDLALDITREILALGVDPADPRILAIVKDMALSVIASQVKIDTAVLTMRCKSVGLSTEAVRQQALDEIDKAFAERPKEVAVPEKP